MAWWDNIANWKRLGIIAGAISAAIAAIIAVANVLEAGEKHWIATRGFVRIEVAQSVKDTASSINVLGKQATRTEIQVLRSQRDGLIAKIKDRELLLQQDGPPGYKRLVEEQLGEFKTDLARQDRRIQEIEDKLRDMH